MTDRKSLEEAARAANQAADTFARRGQTDEAAISRLMADRYIKQLNDKEK